MSNAKKEGNYPRLTDDEIARRAAITMSIEVKTNFELYAYRVISHEEFVARVKDLCKVFQYSIKPSKNGKDPKQLDLVDAIHETGNS